MRPKTREKANQGKKKQRPEPCPGTVCARVAFRWSWFGRGSNGACDQREAREMPGIRYRTSVTLAAASMLTVVAVGALAAETPKRGGILTFVVAGGAPSFDAHRAFL